MNEMSDRVFMDHIDAIEREMSAAGDALPGDRAAELALPADAAPDDRAALEVARRLLAERRPLPGRLASPEWIRAQAGDAEPAVSAGSAGSPDSTPAASPHTDLAAPAAAGSRWGRAWNRTVRPRWLPEAAVAALILALGMLAVQWLPASRENSGDRTLPAHPPLDAAAPAYPPPGFGPAYPQSPQRSLDDPEALLRLLGQVGGVLKHGAEASDGRLYLGAGPRLLVVDLAAEADAEGESGERGSGLTAQVVTGQTGRLDGMIEDLVVGEGYVYAWEGPPSNGLRVIDVRDDTAPTPVGFVRPSNEGPIRAAALAREGDTVWVALEHGGTAALYGFDVADPAKPREVESIGLMGAAETLDGMSLVIVDGYAYLAQGGSWFQVVDLRARTTVLGSLEGLVQLAISGSTLFAVTGEKDGDSMHHSLLALDVTAPEAPREIGRLPIEGVDAVLDLLVDDGHAFILTYDRASDDRMVGGGKALRVIDVTRPEAPREVAVVEGDDVGAGAVALAKSGDDVFVVHDTGRAWNIDVSRPEHPWHNRGWGQDLSVGGAFDSVTAAEIDGKKAVLTSRHGDRIILDMSDAEAPEAMGSGGGSHRLNGGGGIVMIDGEPVGPPFEWQTERSNRDWDGNNPTWDGLALSIEDPRYSWGADDALLPSLYIDITSLGPPVDVQINDGWLYVLGRESLAAYQLDVDTKRFRVDVFLPPPSGPFPTPALPTPDPATFGRFLPLTEAAGMVLAPPFAYIADAGAGGGLRVLDISDPSRPREITRLPVGTGGLLAVARVSDILLVADATGSLFTIAVNDPSQPRLLATRELSRAAFARPGPYAIAFRDGLAYVAGGGALRVVDVGDPLQPREIEHFLLPGTPRHLALDGDRLYVACGAGGLWIFEVPEREWATWTPGAPVVATEAATVTATPTPRPSDGPTATPTPGPTLDPEVPAFALDEWVVGRVGGGGKDPTGSHAVIAVAGQRAFIADGRHLFIQDVSDPSQPRRIGEFHLPHAPASAPGSDEHRIEAIEVYADVAYLLTSDGIFHVIDVTDPTEPRAVGEALAVFDTDRAEAGGATSMYREGESLYVAGGATDQGTTAFARENLVAVIDLTDPARPRLSDPWIVPPEDTPDAAHSPNLMPEVIGPPDGKGPTLLIEDRHYNRDRVTVLATTAAGRASGAATLDLERGVITAATDGRYAYLLAYPFGGAGDQKSQKSIVVLDLTKPAAPRQVNEIAYPDLDGPEREFPLDAQIANGQLYVAESMSNDLTMDLDASVAALRVFSLVDPTAPRETGYLLTELAPAARSLAVDGRTVYLPGAGGRLLAVDVTRPDQPRLVADHAAVGWVSRVDLSERWPDHVFAGQRAVDVSDPSDPRPFDATSAPWPGGTISGDRAFSLERTFGMRVHDVSNLESPREIGAYEAGGNAVQVVVDGDFAYLGHTGNGSRGARYQGPDPARQIDIVDVRDPARPVLAGTLDFEAELRTIDERGGWWGEVRGWEVAGDRLIVLLTNALHVYDIADPAAPRRLGTLALETPGYGLVLGGDIAWVREGRGWYPEEAFGGDLVAIDVRDPAAPREVGRIRIGSAAPGVFTLAEKVAYVADDDYIRVFDIANPAAPRELGRLAAPGTVADLAVAGDRLYVAAGADGLLVGPAGESVADGSVFQGMHR